MSKTLELVLDLLINRRDDSVRRFEDLLVMPCVALIPDPVDGRLKSQKCESQSIAVPWQSLKLKKTVIPRGEGLKLTTMSDARPDSCAETTLKEKMVSCLCDSVAK